MNKLLLLVIGLSLFSLPAFAGEYLMNDTGEIANVLRVIFTEPVTITDFGDMLLAVDPQDESMEFVFSGWEVPPWSGHWLNWEPETATIASYMWEIDLETLPRLHAPIIIVGDSSFADPANGVISGKGSKSDPYIISGWRIDGGDVCIYIEGTTKYFLIQDCALNTGGNGILIAHSSNGRIEKCRIASVGLTSCSSAVQGEYNCCGDGICIYRSRDVTVRNNTVRDSNASGISLYGSSNCLVEANRVLRNGGEGIEVSRNSDGNTVIENWVERNGQDVYFGICVTCDCCGNTVLNNTLLANGGGAIRVDPRCEVECSNFISGNKEL
jgi:parallel beta-helix repeat protein